MGGRSDHIQRNPPPQVDSEPPMEVKGTKRHALHEPITQTVSKRRVRRPFPDPALDTSAEYKLNVQATFDDIMNGDDM